MRRSIAVVLLSLIVTAVACGDDNGDRDSSVTIALGDEPATLDPHILQDRRLAESNIFETLVDRDLDDPVTLIPLLATELPEQIGDTTWQVKIREGVTFTNGEPFNAEVAAFSIMRMIDPAIDSDRASQLETITSAEATDEYTLQIETRGPDPIIPSRLYQVSMVPMEYSQDDAFARSPVGTGPYKFVEWRSGVHIDLTRNDDYWGDAPEIESARFMFLPDNQSRVAGLQAGEIDLAVNLAPESADEVPQLIHREGLEFPWLRLKTYEGPFQDERIRRAAAYALDVPAYVDSLYEGYASPVQCQVSGPGIFGFNPDLEPYPYDPDESRALLEEAGYGGEEVRIVAPQGRWLKFEELSEAIDADLTAVGFNVDMDLMLLDPWVDEILRPVGEGQPDGALSAASNDLLDTDRVSALVGPSGTNSSNDDAELEAMLGEARTTLDVDTRERLYHDITQTICDEVLFVPILTFQDIYGASENLEWPPRVDGLIRVEEMHLK